MAQILYVTNILFDFGALAQLQAECERVGIRRPLIVTDAGVKAVGLLDKALAALDLGPAVDQRRPAGAQRLDLRAGQHDARLEGVVDVEVVPSFPVRRDELASRLLGHGSRLGDRRPRLHRQYAGVTSR